MPRSRVRSLDATGIVGTVYSSEKLSRSSFVKEIDRRSADGCEAVNSMGHISILSMPDELQMAVFRFMDCASLGKLACVSRRMCEIVSKDEIWEHRVAHDFGVEARDVPEIVELEKWHDKYMRLLLDPALSHYGCKHFFDDVWRRLSNWTLLVTTERVTEQVLDARCLELGTPHTIYETQAVPERIDKYLQGFRLTFGIKDWSIFHRDDTLPFDSCIRVQLLVNLGGKRIVVEDWCPFGLPVRTVRGMFSLNVWNEGGSMQYIGLRESRGGPNRKLIVLSMHFMRLLGALESLPKWISRPRFKRRFFTNNQRSATKCFVDVFSQHLVPDDVWLYTELVGVQGKKLGVLRGVISNARSDKADVAGDFCVDGLGDVSELAYGDGGVYDAGRRLINGFCGVPWRQVIYTVRGHYWSFEVQMTFFTVFKVLRVNLWPNKEGGVGKVEWEVCDHHSRVGLHLCAQ